MWTGYNFWFLDELLYQMKCHFQTANTLPTYRYLVKKEKAFCHTALEDEHAQRLRPGEKAREESRWIIFSQLDLSQWQHFKPMREELDIRKGNQKLVSNGSGLIFHSMGCSTVTENRKKESTGKVIGSSVFNRTKCHLTPNSLRKPLKEKVGDREKTVNVNGRRKPKQRSRSQFKRSLSEVCRIIQRESTETLKRVKHGAQTWRNQRRGRFDQNKEFISCRLKKGSWELKGKEFEAVHDNRSYRQTRERRLEERHKKTFPPATLACFRNPPARTPTPDSLVLDCCLVPFWILACGCIPSN